MNPEHDFLVAETLLGKMAKYCSFFCGVCGGGGGGLKTHIFIFLQL